MASDHQGASAIEPLARPGAFKVLVIGGSYGGLAAALNLLDLCNGVATRFPSKSLLAEGTANAQPPKINVQITIVDERDGFYHLIGSPLALASKDYSSKVWTRFSDIPALQSPNVRHIHGKVVKVDPQNKVARISELDTSSTQDESYDYLIASSGLRRVWPVVPQSLRRQEYLSETEKHIQSVQNTNHGVVVIGGGAVGIEMAAELKLVCPQQKVTLIHSREHLLSSEPLPDDFKIRTLDVLKETGVEIILGARVNSTTEVKSENGSVHYKISLSNGSEVTTGEVIWAVSKSIPSSGYLPEAALDKEGYVKIGPTLNFTGDVPNAKDHFAIGDIALWSGIKRCGGAMHMGHYAALNIHQLMLSELISSTPQFSELQEFPAVIGLAVGKQAVCYSPTDGTTAGEDVMAIMFGEDLGYSNCWNYMQLSENAHLSSSIPVAS